MSRTRSAPSTMALWAGPMTPTVLDGVQALHWLHAAAEGGPPSQGALGPEKEVVKPPPEGWQWPEPGTRWVLLKADVTKAHRRVKVLRKDWRWGKNGG